jgi:hypothetical protein
MQCSACKAENPRGARFCEQCGVAMELRCPHCGAAAGPGARFCVACGQPLQPVAAPPTETDLKPLLPVVRPLDLTAAAGAFQVPAIWQTRFEPSISRLKANAGR